MSEKRMTRQAAAYDKGMSFLEIHVAHEDVTTVTVYKNQWLSTIHHGQTGELFGLQINSFKALMLDTKEKETADFSKKTSRAKSSGEWMSAVMNWEAPRFKPGIFYSAEDGILSVYFEDRPCVLDDTHPYFHFLLDEENEDKIIGVQIKDFSSFIFDPIFFLLSFL